MHLPPPAPRQHQSFLKKVEVRFDGSYLVLDIVFFFFFVNLVQASHQKGKNLN